MNDRERRSVEPPERVRVLERAENVGDDTQVHLQWNRRVRVACSTKHPMQRLAVQVLHRQKAALKMCIRDRVKYMPPEQATGGAVDSRSDVFAVGIMLWEALVGRGPWHGATDVEIFRSLMSGVVPRLSDANTNLDAKLVAIVDLSLIHI